MGVHFLQLLGDLCPPGMGSRLPAAGAGCAGAASCFRAGAVVCGAGGSSSPGRRLWAVPVQRFLPERASPPCTGGSSGNAAALQPARAPATDAGSCVGSGADCTGSATNLRHFRQRGRLRPAAVQNLLYRCAHKGLHRRSEANGCTAAGCAARATGAACTGTVCRCCGTHDFRRTEQRQFQLCALVTAAWVMCSVPCPGCGWPGWPPAGPAAGLFPGYCVPPLPVTHQRSLVPAAGQSRQHQGAVVGDEFFGQAFNVHRLLPQLGQLGQCGGSVLRFQRASMQTNSCGRSHRPCGTPHPRRSLP